MPENNVDIRVQLNDFLVMEFGVENEGGMRQATASWPFELQPVGRIAPGPGDPDVFSFQLDQPYFALAIGNPHCYPTAGMTFEDLKRQFSGTNWLATQEPIDLETSGTGLLGVPSIPERREAITSLVTSIFGTETNFHILEGLFLRKTVRYYSLVEISPSQKAFLVGSGIAPVSIGFPSAASWRRLSCAIGNCLNKKILSPFA
jgi:hypothetical protein